MPAVDLTFLASGIPLTAVANPPSTGIAHAPARKPNLSDEDKKTALRNALRYFPAEFHAELAKEFAQELTEHGHIYMFRFRPTFDMKAYPITDYPAKCQSAAAIMLMICNNLDPAVAQFPQELVTYGGNGQVFSNWAQFWLTMQYLSQMSEEQTLVMYSGHPMGLFPSHTEAPRLVITNGMVIPNYSSPADYERMFALGVTMYGQMTAGSYCYIGPQGIVHGTTLTVLNAGRRMLKSETESQNSNPLLGKVFLSSGLGGMSGAQPKAAVICGCIGVIAEVSEEALDKRLKQGWVIEICTTLDDLVQKLRQYRKEQKTTSIGFLGNVVDVWERLVEEHKATGQSLVDLASDQTSCHNPYAGGYYPVGLTYQASRDLMTDNPDLFKEKVNESLCRQVAAINYLSKQGLYFFDYGNAFLLQASRAGADVFKSSSSQNKSFRYPSYVQDIMGDIFSMGFGPFRWVCTSCDPQDLSTTDAIAAEVFEELLIEPGLPEQVKLQYLDNLRWIKEAASHKLVVGSQARILYSNQVGRSKLALRFNKAVSEGVLRAPVVISRDHHDVSGTDSPYRETSNINDGSSFCADMAVQNCIGDAFRGATWVALHNGGGTGWGEAVNGGFGLVLDGSESASLRATRMLAWDVSNGVARRSWSGHPLALDTIRATEEASQGGLKVTEPHIASDDIINSAFP